MSINDVMEKELARYKPKGQIRILSEQRIQVLEQPRVRLESYVQQNSRIKADNPSRYELNTMRRRLDRHKRWIQIGILAGILTLGFKIPTYFASKQEPPTRIEYVVETVPESLDTSSIDQFTN